MQKICLALVASLALGCASSTKIPDRTAEPQQLIAAAEERGAQKNPEAQLHLKLALDRVNEATALAAEGEEKKAELLLLRAEADAEYALSLLRRDEAQMQAQEVQAKIDELRKEMAPRVQ